MNRNAVYGPNKNKPPQKEISEDALMKAAQPTNMEKTAIDFFFEKIAENPSEGYYTINGKNVSKEIEQAKAMFRQQIEEAAFEMLDNETCGDENYHEAHKKTASDYFTTKYGG